MEDFVCLPPCVLSKKTTVTYISTVNIIEMSLRAVASCSEIRHDPLDESLPGGSHAEEAGRAEGRESQVIYRKVGEHEERAGGGGVRSDIYPYGNVGGGGGV